MKHTLKWSALIGTGIAGAVMLLLKLLQPITYWHLVAFGYAFVAAAVIAGVVAHINLAKRLRGLGHEIREADKKVEQKIAHAIHIPINSRQANQTQNITPNDFFLHRGKFATLHTHDGKICRGRFQHIDGNHIIMDYISDENNSQNIRSLVMLHKDDVRSLEVE